MASVTLRYEYADGDRVKVKIRVKASYPDAINEAKTNAVAAVRELADSQRITAGEIDPEQ